MVSITLASDVFVPTPGTAARMSAAPTFASGRPTAENRHSQTLVSPEGANSSSAVLESKARAMVEPDLEQEEGTMKLRLGDIEKTVITYVTIEEVSSTPVAELGLDQTFSVVTAE